MPEHQFTAPEIARILRSVDAEVALEAVGLTDLDLLAQRAEILERLEGLKLSLDTLRHEGLKTPPGLNAWNLVGLVALLPLRYFWVGILAYVFIGILTDELSPSDLTQFLGLEGYDFDAQVDLVRSLGVGLQSQATDAVFLSAMVRTEVGELRTRIAFEASATGQALDSDLIVGTLEEGSIAAEIAMGLVQTQRALVTEAFEELANKVLLTS